MSQPFGVLCAWYLERFAEGLVAELPCYPRFDVLSLCQDQFLVKPVLFHRPEFS